jgi:hypothetical protein
LDWEYPDPRAESENTGVAAATKKKKKKKTAKKENGIDFV